MSALSIVAIAVQLVFVLLLPPLLLGIINKTKAAFGGRVGPPYLQVYRDLAKLARKGSVFSQTTTWVFRAGPVVGLVTVLLVSFFVPIGGHPAPLRFDGDFILLAYALALGRFFTVAAALDTGSAFEGMGGAREVTFSCLAEPALFLGLLVLARASGSLSLSDMLGPQLAGAWGVAGASLAAVSASLLVVLLVENSRIPFDDPNTHLELTMIHEVMVLDHSGPALGLILYGASVKLFLFAALVVGIVVPLGTANVWLAWLGFGFALCALAVGIGVLESVMARLRLIQVPTLLVAASLMSAFGVLLVARS